MALGGFLGAAANLGNIYGYGQEAAQRDAEMQLQKLKLQQAQQQQQAQAAAGRALYSPMPGMQGAGMGAPPPPMMPQPGGPGGPAAIGAGMASQPAMPQAAPGAAPAMAPPGGGAGPTPTPGASPMPQTRPMPQQQPMGGQYDIETLAKKIKAQNPSIDDATLFQAVVAQQHLLLPQEQMMLRQELATMQADMRRMQFESNLDIKYAQLGQREEQYRRTADRLDRSLEERQYNDRQRQDRLQRQFDYKQVVDQKRLELEKAKVEGVDQRFVRREQLRLDADALKEKRTDLIRDPKYKLQGLANDVKAINGRISEMLRGRTMDALSGPEKALYQKLTAERDRLNSQADGVVASARRQQKALPTLRDLVNGKANLDLDDPDNLPDEGAAAAAAAQPAGMPDASKVADGSKLKDAQGNVVAVAQGGRWKMVAPGPPTGQ